MINSIPVQNNKGYGFFNEKNLPERWSFLLIINGLILLKKMKLNEMAFRGFMYVFFPEHRVCFPVGCRYRIRNSKVSPFY